MISPEGKSVETDPHAARGFDDYELLIGDVMRGERATMGKTLLDVQNELKIKAQIISAIENADVSVFDVPAFVSGQVRSYANYLGMNADEVFAKFCEEANFHPDNSLGGQRVKTAVGGGALSSGSSDSQRLDQALSGINARFIPPKEGFFERIGPGGLGSFLGLVAVIGTVSYGAWTFIREMQRIDITPIEQAPIVSSDAALLSPEALPLTPPLPAQSAYVRQEALTASLLARDPVYQARPLEVPNVQARDLPIGMIDPFTEEKRLAEQSDVAQLSGGAEAEARGVQVAQEADPSAVLFAVRPSWVRIASADGTILFEKIMDAGESWSVPQSQVPALLRTGNSGALYVSIGAKTYGPIAQGNRVVKNVSLGVEAIETSLQLADITADAELASFVSAGLIAKPAP